MGMKIALHPYFTAQNTHPTLHICVELLLVHLLAQTRDQIMISWNFFLLLTTGVAVGVAEVLLVETNSTADTTALAINATNSSSNASSISPANDTLLFAPSDVSITDLAPKMPTNSGDNVTSVATNNTNSTRTAPRQHINRNWIEVVSPADLSTIIEEDPNKVLSTREVDPFYFTSEPSLAPSSHPSAEPSLLPTSRPTPRPTIWRETSEPRNAGETYFDYSPEKSSRYGPGQKEIYEVKKDGSTKIIYESNNWEKIKNSPEEVYWRPLQKDIKFDLSKNSCGSKSRFQSPIDIWPTDNAEYEEHHQIRHRPGDFRIDGDLIIKQILPSKLRLVFPRRVGEEPDPPFADFPNGWGAAVDALHADFKIPSEHWIKGRQFAAEYQLYHLHRERDRAPVISVMIDLHPDDEPNLHLQKALDEFQKVFDADEQECEEERRRSTRKLGGFSNSSAFLSTSFHRNAQAATTRKVWDPYHPDLMRSIHFYGYSGSLTEPPCTEFCEWRILDTPMQISSAQLLQMKILLFNHVDKKCRLTSNHYEGSVARPIQDSSRRAIYQCTCRDYLADSDDRKKCSKREFRLQRKGLEQ